MGGLWRQIDWSAVKEVQKVKAHIDFEVAERERWLRHWRGNQEADIQELGKERALQAMFLVAAAKKSRSGHRWI
eukprot:14593281-Heterocapsa_arctica.AAC.1